VQAEKARKNAEAELSDSSSHVTEINIVMQNLTNDKHRLEGDMVMMRQQLDDAVTARRAAEERSERLGIEVAYYYYYCKKLNSLKHLVRTNVAESHN